MMPAAVEHTGTRLHLTVHGVVQGVGFRPFVYRLARDCGLSGTVHNSGKGVDIEVQGLRAEEFASRLPAEAPALVMIVGMERRELPLQSDERDFVIVPSEDTAVSTAYIPPDTAVCPECLEEMRDVADRRHRYPFTNCTNCGPRYTITERIPYDRPCTSMKVFPMCAACEAEYHDPENRRFHAQPNACADCGPTLQYRNPGTAETLRAEDALQRTLDDLRAGRIVAIRGLGGYHLAVDAGNDDAVRLLRERKHRYAKPLAVMVPDSGSATALCFLSTEEQAALRSSSRPIVIAEAAPDNDVAPSVTLGNPTLGIMLPYTPLHYLLLEDMRAPLVMTSANLSEEPICIAVDEAEQRLAAIADSFLHHDRDILRRCDDSVLRIQRGTPVPVRRARGFAPRPILLPDDAPPVLAVGAELKNTLCVTKGGAAILSPHIGDLENLETLHFFEETAEHLLRIFEVSPVAVVHDMHPDYLGSTWAQADGGSPLQDALAGLPRIQVQHHHAHLASCLAEHGSDGPAVGIILDGTGYGIDGTSWGGEFLIGDANGFSRAAHFDTMPMPGGNAAIRQPWRMALAYLRAAFGEQWPDAASRFAARRSTQEIDAVQYMLATDTNVPVTSSAGRLFDAVAAISGLYDEVAFEAQAAIALEHAARGRSGIPYNIDLSTRGTGDSAELSMSFLPAIRQITHDVSDGTPVSEIAARFHATVAAGCATVAARIARDHGLRTIVLSGGVFQNSLLFDLLAGELQRRSLKVLGHRHVPANDGGIALGQAVIAHSILKG